MFTGGDILEISWKHASLGSGKWYPKAGEDLTIDPGGIRTNDDEQGITGNGQPIYTMNNKRWAMEGSVAWDSSNKDSEMVKMAALAESPVEANFTISLINGSVWGGTGKPVGDIKGSAKDATMSIKLAGGGKLTKQSS